MKLTSTLSTYVMLLALCFTMSQVPGDAYALKTLAERKEDRKEAVEARREADRQELRNVVSANDKIAAKQEATNKELRELNQQLKELIKLTKANQALQKKLHEEIRKDHQTTHLKLDKLLRK